jgi:hypothetical protein
MGNINFMSVAAAIFFFWMAWHVNHKRATNPSAMPRLKALMNLFGEVLGARVHWCIYVVMPFLLGVMLVLNALRGRGIFN